MRRTARVLAVAVRLIEYDHLQAQQNLQIELDAAAPGTGLTHHAHGEHYKSRAHGEQLACVRLLSVALQ